MDIMGFVNVRLLSRLKCYTHRSLSNQLMASALTEYVEFLAGLPLNQLVPRLDSLEELYRRPRGDLNDWAPLVTRMTRELETVVSQQGLRPPNEGPSIAEVPEYVANILDALRRLLDNNVRSTVFEGQAHVAALTQAITTRVVVAAVRLLSRLDSTISEEVRESLGGILMRLALSVPRQGGPTAVGFALGEEPPASWKNVQIEWPGEIFNGLDIAELRLKVPGSLWGEYAARLRLAKACKGTLHERAELAALQCYALDAASDDGLHLKRVLSDVPDGVQLVSSFMRSPKVLRDAQLELVVSFNEAVRTSATRQIAAQLSQVIRTAAEEHDAAMWTVLAMLAPSLIPAGLVSHLVLVIRNPPSPDAGYQTARILQEVVSESTTGAQALEHAGILSIVEALESAMWSDSSAVSSSTLSRNANALEASRYENSVMSGDISPSDARQGSELSQPSSTSSSLRFTTVSRNDPFEGVKQPIGRDPFAGARLTLTEGANISVAPQDTNHFDGIPRATPVDYAIDSDTRRFISSLLNITSCILTSRRRSTATVTALINSKLLNLCLVIFEDHERFGSRLGGLASRVVALLAEAEPHALASLEEVGKFVHSLADRASSRPQLLHPLTRLAMALDPHIYLPLALHTIEETFLSSDASISDFTSLDGVCTTLIPADVPPEHLIAVLHAKREFAQAALYYVDEMVQGDPRRRNYFVKSGGISPLVSLALAVPSSEDNESDLDSASLLRQISESSDQDSEEVGKCIQKSAESHLCEALRLAMGVWSAEDLPNLGPLGRKLAGIEDHDFQLVIADYWDHCFDGDRFILDVENDILEFIYAMASNPMSPETGDLIMLIPRRKFAHKQSGIAQGIVKLAKSLLDAKKGGAAADKVEDSLTRLAPVMEATCTRNIFTPFVSELFPYIKDMGAALPHLLSWMGGSSELSSALVDAAKLNPTDVHIARATAARKIMAVSHTYESNLSPAAYQYFALAGKSPPTIPLYRCLQNPPDAYYLASALAAFELHPTLNWGPLSENVKRFTTEATDQHAARLVLESAARVALKVASIYPDSAISPQLRSVFQELLQGCRRLNFYPFIVHAIARYSSEGSGDALQNLLGVRLEEHFATKNSQQNSLDAVMSRPGAREAACRVLCRVNGTILPRRVIPGQEVPDLSGTAPWWPVADLLNALEEALVARNIANSEQFRRENDFAEYLLRILANTTELLRGARQSLLWWPNTPPTNGAVPEESAAIKLLFRLLNYDEGIGDLLDDIEDAHTALAHQAHSIFLCLVLNPSDCLPTQESLGYVKSVCQLILKEAMLALSKSKGPTLMHKVLDILEAMNTDANDPTWHRLEPDYWAFELQKPFFNMFLKDITERIDPYTPAGIHARSCVAYYLSTNAQLDNTYIQTPNQAEEQGDDEPWEDEDSNESEVEVVMEVEEEDSDNDAYRNSALGMYESAPEMDQNEVLEDYLSGSDGYDDGMSGENGYSDEYDEEEDFTDDLGEVGHEDISMDDTLSGVESQGSGDEDEDEEEEDEEAMSFDAFSHSTSSESSIAPYANEPVGLHPLFTTDEPEQSPSVWSITKRLFRLTSEPLPPLTVLHLPQNLSIRALQNRADHIIAPATHEAHAKDRPPESPRSFLTLPVIPTSLRFLFYPATIKDLRPFIDLLRQCCYNDTASLNVADALMRVLASALESTLPICYAEFGRESGAAQLFPLGPSATPVAASSNILECLADLCSSESAVAYRVQSLQGRVVLKSLAEAPFVKHSSQLLKALAGLLEQVGYSASEPLVDVATIILEAPECTASAFNICRELFMQCNMTDIISHLIPAARVAKAIAFSTDESEEASNRFLRLLTVIDHVLQSPALEEQLRKLGPWDSCWEFLGKKLEERPNDVQLLPLLESLTLVAGSINEESTKLVAFAQKYREAVNELVRSNPRLLGGPLSALGRDPRVLDFDNRLSLFQRQSSPGNYGNTITLRVRRSNVLQDSFEQITLFNEEGLLRDEALEVQFEGEEAVDAGGVAREWLACLCQEILSPHYALFTKLEGVNVFQINVASGVNPDHLQYFHFLGLILGRAVLDRRTVDCHFFRIIYKFLLERPVTLSDMESVDPSYYRSLKWMLNNDITDVVEATFAVETEEFGANKTYPLIPGGENIPVTEDNKEEYIRLLVEFKLVTSVKDQLEALREGFHQVVDSERVEMFDEQELELIICGLPNIDIDDWRRNTVYQGYTATSSQVRWFWRALASFGADERAKVLQFATGTSKVPVQGFSSLESTDGPGKFTIVREFTGEDRLPSAHTCSNQLSLPPYNSYETLREALVKAITLGSTGFGFA